MDRSSTVYTTKPFMSGRSQAIRIPQQYRFDDEEVVINKVGECLMITPASSMQRLFYYGASLLTDDFLAGGRPEETANTRTDL